MSTGGKAAVFLDRDGTIIHDVGYLGDESGIRLYPDAVGALRRLGERYELFVVTNQQGISQGVLGREQVEGVNRRLGEMLAEKGIHIRQWYYCPHTREEACECIKPHPFFLREAQREYGLDLARSFVVGDHPHDPETADAVGATGLYLLTGHGARHLGELGEDKLVFHTLEDAVEWIIAHPRGWADVEEQIAAAAEAIAGGGLAAFPTETVYGLGADALNGRAVARIFEVKGRPLDDPLIVHVAEMEQVFELAEAVPAAARKLMSAMWPGPLTLVLAKRSAVGDIVTAGLGTVAVRMPSNPIARELIRRAGRPVAAPSANLFGQTSPTTAEHVARQLGREWGVIIDGGACRVGIESTVLSVAGDEAVLLRPGGVSREEIEELIGPVAVAGTGAGQSPGMMESHYAPRTPLVVAADVGEYAGNPRAGLLAMGPVEVDAAGPVETLSERGELREAAMNLYAAMRRLDAMGLEVIVAIPAADEGLGHAINDRLRKAAGRGGG